MRTLLAALLVALPAAGCGQVDLNAVPSAKALCEASTDYLRQPSARMLPGRRCLECHQSGGQASRLPWTAAGTVYSSPTSDCNSGGVEGAKVEIIDSQGKVVITMMTNRSGNFFTAEPLGQLPVRARITKGNLLREMQQLQALPVDCASCHYPAGNGVPAGPGGGRIYLN